MARLSSEYCIGADVGGTSIRCALVDSSGAVRRGSFAQRAVPSHGTAAGILGAFDQALGHCLAQARSEGLALAGIGIGMCGPMEYTRGISRMRGLDKYEAIYGFDLKLALRGRLGLAASFPIVFEMDSQAFAQGEAWRGAARGFRRILAVTLGTGLGTAFLADGRIVAEGPGVPPPYGWLGQIPCGDGILDDVVSRRGIIALYRSLAAEADPAGGCKGASRIAGTADGADVSDIARWARADRPAALRTFREFGHTLGAALAPSLDAFRGECLVIGGRISRAFSLFERPLRAELRGVRSLRRIAVAQSSRLSALRGSARYAFLEGKRE